MDDDGAPHATHRLAVALVAILGIVAALAWFAWIFVTFREGVAPLSSGEWIYAYGDVWAYDLDAYMLAATRLNETGSLYDPFLTQAPFNPGPPTLFYYAPPLGVAMLPIADIAVHDSSVAWYVLRIAAFALACGLMPVRPLIRVFAFVVMSLTIWAMKDAIAANVSMLLVLPYVVAWRWMDRPLGSIAIAATVSIRPTMAIFLLWQALRRRWRALAWTIGTGMVLLVVTLPFVGIDGYVDYLAVASNLNPPAGPSENRDLGGVLIELGIVGSAVDIARIGSVGLGIVLVLLGLRKDREVSYMITLSASLLMLPLLWNLYLITLVLPLALLAHRWRPIVLLVPLLSWLPDVITPFIVLGVIAALFVVPDAPAEDAGVDGAPPRVKPDTHGAPAPAS
jgi:hypothetical protein